MREVRSRRKLIALARIRTEAEIGGYDLIIVGAGSAGCALAARLSEDPSRSVLLIESGPDFASPAELPRSIRERSYRPVDDPEFLWPYEVEVTSGRIVPTPRGRLVGGSGAVNGSLFMRGLPEDFDSWGRPLWTWEAVLPYFNRLERDLDFAADYHGDSGPIAVRRYPCDGRQPSFQASFYSACFDHGFPEKSDLNSPTGHGVGPAPLNNVADLRTSSAIAYLPAARQRRNLEISARTTIHRVVLSGDRAIAVDGVARGAQFRAEGDEIVLAAGGIASPQLLMLSGIGSASVLEPLGIDVKHELPGVGGNLRDHPVVIVPFRGSEAFVEDADSPGTQTVLGYSAPGSDTSCDIHLIADTTALGGSTGHEAFGDVRLLCILERAESAGTMTVASTDPMVPPVMKYGYLADEPDRRRLRHAVRLGIELATSPACADLISECISPTERDLSSDAALDRWLLDSVDTARHTSGGCRMGSFDDNLAVVDDHCRVHGIEGLRVVDLSILPNIVRGPTNATAVMLGERASDLIASN